TDGLGAWAPDRHPLTALVGAGALLFLGTAAAALIRARRTEPGTRPLAVLALSCAAYALWILAFQHVVHQTRHVLPLVPPLLIVLAAGLAPAVARKPGEAHAFGTAFRRSAAVMFLTAYAATGLTLAVQHMRPAAIAQVVERLRSNTDPHLLIVGAPW